MRRCHLGVTLVDLLVLLFIMFLSASMLVVALAQAEEHSDSVSCKANLEILWAALELHKADHDGALPSQRHAAESLVPNKEKAKLSPKFSGPIRRMWLGQLYPYFENWEMLKCPSANEKELPFMDGHLVSYGFNFTFTYAEANPPAHNLRVWPFLPKLTLESREADHVAFADANYPFIGYMWEYLKGIGFANGSHYRLHSWREFGLHERPTEKDRRHPNGSNIIFMDGHIETMTYEQIIESRINYYLFTEDGDFI